MALKKIAQKENIKVIVREDSAIPKELSNESWEKYVETLDESFLELTAEPTYFVLKLAKDLKTIKYIQRESVDMSKNNASFDPSAMFEYVRASLIDIINPESLEEDARIIYKKGKDGYASEELIAYLANISGQSIIHILFNFIIKYSQSSETIQKKA